MKPVLLPARTLELCFSATYAEAQEKFRQLAKGDDSRYLEFVYTPAGPQREKLSTAVHWRGEPDAPLVLVIQSATHGVEGFAGSAIQLDALQRLAEEPLPPGVGLLLIHAINPFGFAWLRRVNEEGVDLNRNFIDFSRPLPPNPGYAELAQALLPEAGADWDEASRRLDDYRDEFGQQALELAVSSGQYDYPDGLFYGGRGPSPSRRHLEAIIEQFRLTERDRVAVIDVHTGLGPFGYGEVICDHPPQSTGVRLARQWYGDSVTEPALGSSSSVPKQGLIDYLWQQRLGERVCFVTLEFGTYPIAGMFEALRRDHLLHRRPVSWEAADTQRVKRMMRDYFYPGSADWQELVLLRGRQLIRQALNGLTGRL
jgi:hypothetical protein